MQIEPSSHHDLPLDMQQVLESNPDLLALWNAITPIARNEWICWVSLVKTEETRKRHIERMQEDLRAGKKRPCCWPGCPHRNPKNKKWFKGLEL